MAQRQLNITSMSAAFERAGGLTPAEAKLNIALAEYFNNGGKVDRAYALVSQAAAKLLSGGRRVVAPVGQLRNAFTQQPYDGEEGQLPPDRKVHISGAPSSSPVANGMGHVRTAGNGQGKTAHPVREPSASHRRAALIVAKASSKTVLDRLKTSDGRAWGDIGAHELDGMERDGVLATAIKGKLGALSNSQRFKPLRELLKPSEFERLVRSVRGQTVVAEVDHE